MNDTKFTRYYLKQIRKSAEAGDIDGVMEYTQNLMFEASEAGIRIRRHDKRIDELEKRVAELEKMLDDK